MPLRNAIINSALGDLTLVTDGDALSGLYFPGHWYMPSASALGERVDPGSEPLFVEARTQLTDYLQRHRAGFVLPIATHGEAFQERVWAILREIPRGATTTYGAIAEQLGDTSLAQQVGQAVGRNPVSIVIPCHRVIGANGKLTGYAGGLWRKRFLLDLEEPAVVASARLF